MRDKIEILFNYRKIPWLLECTSIEDKGGFMHDLVDLQVAIYHLDTYLESKWEIDLNVLGHYWQEIYARLVKVGLSIEQVPSWVREIKIYEARELALRDRVSPLIQDIENLYYYKSCDVRLMRRLIYHVDPVVENTIHFSDWEEFDLLTEVNDDVEDLIEDMQILNGNRFLFSLYEKGTMETEKIYEEFIHEKVEKARERFSTAGGERMTISKLVDQIAIDTEHLLKARIRQIDLKKLGQSKVIEAYESRDIHKA